MARLAGADFADDETVGVGEQPGGVELERVEPEAAHAAGDVHAYIRAACPEAFVGVERVDRGEVRHGRAVPDRAAELRAGTTRRWRGSSIRRWVHRCWLLPATLRPRGRQATQAGVVSGFEGPKVDEGLAGGLFDSDGRVIERVQVGGGDVDEADEPELGVSFGQLAFARPRRRRGVCVLVALIRNPFRSFMSASASRAMTSRSAARAARDIGTGSITTQTVRVERASASSGPSQSDGDRQLWPRRDPVGAMDRPVDSNVSPIGFNGHGPPLERAVACRGGEWVRVVARVCFGSGRVGPRPYRRG